MRGLIVDILLFAIITFLCISVFGEDWRDENMVWDEEKQKWVTVENPRSEEEKKEDAKFDKVQWSYSSPGAGMPPIPSWEYYLPKSVKRGERKATQSETLTAQRKHYARVLRTKRAMAEAERRRQVMAYRKATGWHDARRNRGAEISSWVLQGHMNSVRVYSSNSY